MRFFYGVALGAGDGAAIDTLGFTQIGSEISIPAVTDSDAHLSGSVDVSSVPAGSTIWVDFTYTGEVDDGQEFMLDNISVTAGLEDTTAPTLSDFGPLTGTSFPLTFSGPNGQNYKVLSSTNVALPLASWTALTNGTFGAGPVTCTDTSATNVQQFYRIRSP